MSNCLLLLKVKLKPSHEPDGFETCPIPDHTRSNSHDDQYLEMEDLYHDEGKYICIFFI